MKKNIGEQDKAVRLLLGVVIVGLGFFSQSWLGLIGLIIIATALMNYCPLYHILGKSTWKPPIKPE